MVQLDGTDFKKINISFTVLKCSEKEGKTSLTEQSEIYVIAVHGRMPITEVLPAFTL